MAITVGPDRGELTLHTTTAGAASRAGHDLTIAIEAWSAEITVSSDEPVAVTLTADLSSMVVTGGTGGLKPLSPGDRKTIVKNALKTLGAATHPAVTFTSGSVGPTAGGYTITGELAIAGTTRTVTMSVGTVPTDGGTTATAAVVVSQRAFGISPYSAMLGALKVADEVTVRLSVRVPA